MQPAEQGDQTATAIVVERDLTLSIDRGQREVGSGITGAQGRERHDESLLTTRDSSARLTWAAGGAIVAPGGGRKAGVPPAARLAALGLR